MAHTGGLKCIAVTLLLFGVAILIFGVIITPKELPRLFNGQLDDYLVVDSTSSQQYSDWAGGGDKKNPFYLVVHMFNLTNVDDVIQGAVPVYNTVGPYMFRRYRTSINVSFPENGDQIQYSNFEDYYFDTNVSGPGLSDTDMFININPVYIGALMQATIPNNALGNSGQANMIMAASGGLITGFTNYFTGPFITLFTALKFPGYFANIMEQNIALLNVTYSNQEAYSIFIDAWRNGTAPTIGNWTGVLINEGGVPTGIDASSAQQLLNPLIPFSLLDGSFESAWFWDQAQGNITIAQNLTSTFNITPAQLAAITTWRNAVFAPIYMFPVIISQFGLDDITDLGWVQFANTKPLGKSITVFPDLAAIGYYTKIELDNTDLSWQGWRSVLDPNTGLGNITNFQAWFMAYGNGASNFSEWGLTGQTAMDIVLYLLAIDPNQAVPSIAVNMGQYGGLFVTKSVSAWTFYCDDYLLNLLREVPPMCSFRLNHTATPPNTILSGKSDINTINTYTEWQGQSEINIWQSPTPVLGHTELGQFQPGINNYQPIAVFQDDTVRTVYLNYSSNTTVEGIEAVRYVLDYNRTFGVSDLYFQYQAGLANMTSFHSGSPIFLSLWDMLYVQNATSWVSGLNATNEFNDSTVIDVEPTTGKAIQSRKRMQVNVNVPNAAVDWFDAGSTYANLTVGIVYPIAKLGEYATISADEASLLRSKLSLAPRITNISFYVGVVVGPVFVVLGFALFFLARRKHHNRERESLLHHHH